jgi:hypothetical protein
LIPSRIYKIYINNQEDLNIIYNFEYKKYEFNENKIEIVNTFYEKYLNKKK